MKKFNYPSLAQKNQIILWLTEEGDDPDQLNNNNLDQYIFEFFECESSTRLLLFPDTGHDKTEETLEKYKQELQLYDIHENHHYKVEHIDFENDSDSEIDNTFKYRHEYCFKWNEEFILKYE